MNKFFGNKFMQLLFLSNVLQLSVTDGDGGGSAGAEGGEGDGDGAGSDGGNAGGDSGSQNDGGNANNGGSDDWKVDDLPQGAQDLIKSLRKENAEKRTGAKGLQDRLDNLEKGLKSALGLSDEDKMTPEQQISNLTAQNEDYSMKNAILEVAIENGLNKEQSDYFGYLLQKEAESLEDDQELADERYEELVAKAKTLNGGASGKPADTDVDGDSDTPPAGGSGSGDAVTAEQFSKMNYMEKVQLRQKDENLYNKLFSEASGKGLI